MDVGALVVERFREAVAAIGDAGMAMRLARKQVQREIGAAAWTAFSNSRDAEQLRRTRGKDDPSRMRRADRRIEHRLVAGCPAPPDETAYDPG